MFKFRPLLPRIALMLSAGLVLCGVTGYLARGALAGWAMRSALHRAGAENIRLNVSEVSLRRVVVDNVGFTLHRQSVTAARLTFARERWWMPSLGHVSVSAMRVPVNMVTLTQPSAAPRTEATPPPTLSLKPIRIPAEAVSIEGHLVVQAPGLEQALRVKVDATLGPDQRWSAQAAADGPGMKLRAEAEYQQDSGALACRVPLAHLDLAQWSDFIQRVAPAGTPNDWMVAGQIDATLAGSFILGKPAAATAIVCLREGGLSSVAQKISVHGIEADLAFADVRQLQTPPGQKLRAATATFGNLSARSLEAEFQLQGPERIQLARFGMAALGGHITTEPFTLSPSHGELDVTFLADGLDIAELMALAPDVPGKANGRLNGRMPLHVDSDGVHFGRGWAALAPATTAELRLNAQGLLTGGMSTSSPSYAVLSRIEGGLLRLKLRELRLEVHPENAPEGRTATLRLEGSPVDESVKAPVSLEVNVNGPVERLLNLGLNSHLKTGTSKPE